LQVLELATEMKLLKLGTVCLDGTRIHANASHHSALSHGQSAVKLTGVPLTGIRLGASRERVKRQPSLMD